MCDKCLSTYQTAPIVHLLRLFKASGDVRIRNRILTENMAIVYEGCHRHCERIGIGRYRPEKGDPFFNDLVQTASIAMIKAIESFDIERQEDESPNLFFVHAQWKIRHELTEWEGKSRGGRRDQDSELDPDALQECLMPGSVQRTDGPTPEAFVHTNREQAALDLLDLAASEEDLTLMLDEIERYGYVRSEGPLLRARRRIHETPDQD